MTVPRPTIPPPRSSVPVPDSHASGLSFGTFLIGMLLLGVILAGVYLFATGALDGVIGATAGPRRTPIIPATTQPDTPTEVPTPTQPGETPVPEVTMPRLVGLESQQARDLLLSLNLIAREDAPINSDTVQPGVVLNQFPRAGDPVSATTTITFVVSLGPEVEEVPNVVGERVINAKIRLEQLGFVVAVVEENSDTSEGFVTRTDPPAGVRPPRGETITVYYSNGNKTTMPDVTGLSIDEARRRIQEAGLTISFEDQQGCDDLPADVCANSVPGQVVSSIPRGGERVPRGTGVTLGVRAP